MNKKAQEVLEETQQAYYQRIRRQIKKVFKDIEKFPVGKQRKFITNVYRSTVLSLVNELIEEIENLRAKLKQL